MTTGKDLLLSGAKEGKQDEGDPLVQDLLDALADKDHSAVREALRELTASQDDDK